METNIETSAELAAFAEAKAQADLKMTSAAFDSVNPHFRSKYASLASVMRAIKPLAEAGITVTQVPFASDGRVGVITMLIHGKSGQWVRGTISEKASRPGPQEMGSLLTYLRRYSLASMVGVASDEDDDGNAAQTAPQKQEEKKVDPVEYIDALVIKDLKEAISKAAGGAKVALWKAWIEKVIGEPVAGLDKIPVKFMETIREACSEEKAA